MWHNYLITRCAKQGTIVSALAALMVGVLSDPARADISIVISQPMPVNAQVYSVPGIYSTVYATPNYAVSPGSTVQTISVTPIGGHYGYTYSYPAQTGRIYGLGTTTPYVGSQRYPIVPQQTLIRPVIVNSPVQNSVLVNPVLINSPIQSGTVIVTPRTITTPGYLVTPGTSIYPGHVGYPGPVIYPGTIRRRSVSISF